MEENMNEGLTVDLDKKLNDVFAGRVVRKDLTNLIKEGANVPIYVLEYLLGMYAATDDEDSIREGLERVKKILSEISFVLMRQRRLNLVYGNMVNTLL